MASDERHVPVPDTCRKTSREVCLDHLVKRTEFKPLPFPEASSVELALTNALFNELLDPGDVMASVEVLKISMSEMKNGNKGFAGVRNGWSRDRGLVEDATVLCT